MVTSRREACWFDEWIDPESIIRTRSTYEIKLKLVLFWVAVFNSDAEGADVSFGNRKQATQAAKMLWCTSITGQFAAEECKHN